MTADLRGLRTINKSTVKFSTVILLFSVLQILVNPRSSAAGPFLKPNKKAA
jgi:hypothetical protein